MAKLLAGRDPRYQRGIALVFLFGLAISTGGVIVRQIDDANSWQILFYRSLTAAISLLILVVARYRTQIVERTLATGWGGLAYAITLGVGFACFLQALTLTNVANVSAISASTPMLAAIAARVFLRETVARAVTAAIFLGFAGVIVMVADGFDGSGLKGNLIALGVPTSSAVVVVVVRLRPTVDMTPATVGAGVVGLLIGLVAAWDITIPWHDAGLSLLLGFVQIGIGFTALNIVARYVPAAEVGLFPLAEPVLAPLWVWIAVAEVPTLLGFVGAGLVIVAAGSISVHRLYQSRRHKPAPAFEAP